MNAFAKEVENDVIAMCITSAIEGIDSRLRFDDEAFKDLHCECLHDVVAVVEMALAKLPSTKRPPTAEHLVETVIAQMLPSIDCPPKHIPMTEAFGDEQINRIMEWRRRN
jgi:hypothetical protein